MFSSLIIHDCGTIDGEPISVTLRASPSFPCAVWFQQDWQQPVPATWVAKEISGFDGTLEVKLVERISEGRIGVAYIAQVLSATQQGTDIQATIPPTLCLKFAKPEFSRSLARLGDAWFYEQMESLQGISVPTCFGFFASTAEDLEKRANPHESNLDVSPARIKFEIEPWKRRKVLFEDTDRIPRNIDQYPSADWQSDDRGTSGKGMSRIIRLSLCLFSSCLVRLAMDGELILIRKP
ncbi:protein kinase subdomain-containing protein PKL/ccin3 [Coprinopsis cinerea AmutBmut pab1-1]|nr:protein kinase subdomain-containing protein PKL/ccin3 [Coprinopsis cinerea AmutBmut pab1-1]